MRSPALEPIAAAVLLLAPAALAAQAPGENPPGRDRIIVTAPSQVQESTARGQARQIMPPAFSSSDPLARFQKPLCAGVLGLDEATARLMIERIAHNARQLGLAVEEQEGCSANLLVAFVPDPAAEFETLAGADHELVDALSFWEKKRVREQSGPVRAWNVTSLRSSNGLTNFGHPPQVESTQSSHLNLGARRDIEASVVAIALDAVAGMDAVALADYVTMRGLARTEPPGGAPTYATILELFELGSDSPQRLTAFDQAYLRMTYSGPASRTAASALGNLPGLLREEASAAGRH